MSWWRNFLSGWGAEPETGKLRAMKPDIKYIPLKADQYYPSAQKKTHIFCHHSAGGSAASSIAWWAADPKRIATPYIIDRDGTIYETFDPSFWAYHLGVKGGTWLEKASVGIEICSYGQLTKNKGGKYLTYTKKEIPPENAIELEFRDFDYWEAYTPEQIAALRKLLPWLVERFGIVLQADRKNFWEYWGPSPGPGIWSHTSVRKDKVDIFPQPELVNLVYGL